MDAMEALLTRRSIRTFLSRKIPDKLLQDLLEAAMAAPSASNRRPWHFVVIDDREILDEVPRFHPYARMLREAPVAILICSDPGIEPQESFQIQDGSAAAENLLLAAHAGGLGGVWLGIHPIEERVAGMRRLLNLPEAILPLALLALGYSPQKGERTDRYQASRIHRNRW
jgi:nitroreductase